VFSLKGASSIKKAQGLLAVGLVAAILCAAVGFNVNAQDSAEDQRYVHSYLDDGVLGNWTPLTFPKKANPTTETVVAYAANSTALENATLLHTTDQGVNTTTLPMAAIKVTCNVTIPCQEAGSLMEDTAQAADTLENNLTATENFAKAPSLMSFNSMRKTVLSGENITVTGTLEPLNADDLITVQFMGSNETVTTTCFTSENGTFTASFKPETSGIWTAQATFTGNSVTYGCESGIILVMVEEQSFLAANGLFIGGGASSALAAVGVVVYFKRFRQ